MKKQTTAQKVRASIQAHIAHNNDKTSGHLENALNHLDNMVDNQLSVRSATSGNLLPAQVITTSKVRNLLGLPHIKMVVVGSNLKGVQVRSGWYRNANIIQGFAE